MPFVVVWCSVFVVRCVLLVWLMSAVRDALSLVVCCSLFACWLLLSVVCGSLLSVWRLLLPFVVCSCVVTSFILRCSVLSAVVCSCLLVVVSCSLFCVVCCMWLECCCLLYVLFVVMCC